MTTCWALDTDSEPVLHGPYEDSDCRDVAVWRLGRRSDHKCIYTMDITDGIPRAFGYSGAFWDNADILLRDDGYEVHDGQCNCGCCHPSTHRAWRYQIMDPIENEVAEVAYGPDKETAYEIAKTIAMRIVYGEEYDLHGES